MGKNIITSYSEYITEGLDKSYDLTKIESYLKRIGFDELAYSNRTGALCLDVIGKFRDKYLDVIKTLENLYGWFLSGITVGHDNDMDSDIGAFKRDFYDIVDNLNDGDDEDNDILLTLWFEPKYNTLLSAYNLPDTIYHITDLKYLDKIKTLGLTPKSKSKMSYHPERIYFITDKTSVDELLQHSNFLIAVPVLLTIDISELKHKYKFYTDPNFAESGIYTLSNIPSKYIIETEKVQKPEYVSGWSDEDEY